MGDPANWLAASAKERLVVRQVRTYDELTDLFEFFSKLNVYSLGTTAANLFNDFRKSGVKIGTMDLKTACIAIANDALLLTANKRDFEKVPGLRFDNLFD